MSGCGWLAFWVVISQYALNLCRVAVKQSHSNNDDARVQILKEIQIMTKLNHPNIIALVAAVPQAAAPALVLEYAALGDLHSYLISLRSTGQPTPPTIYTWIQQLASALGYLASLSIVHRDVAARNVLVMETDQVKLADVGLSRLHDQGTYYRQASSDAMPLRWLSPEAIVERKFSVASDVWGFGVLMWEMITWAKVPFGESSSQGTAQRIMKSDMPAIPKQCPQPLRELIQTCWRLKPEHRPDFNQLELQATMVRRVWYMYCHT
eukprot:m.196760 g.196760  ORF g.196760 m.196760 type:complete len:265 (-) comp17016_c0_seq27:423-1217(-)